MAADDCDEPLAEISQDERLAIYTTQLPDGNLFYAIGVSPDDEFPDYDVTFGRVIGTIQFAR